jgi:hypothetical protein
VGRCWHNPSSFPYPTPYRAEFITLEATTDVHVWRGGDGGSGREADRFILSGLPHHSEPLGGASTSSPMASCEQDSSLISCLFPVAGKAKTSPARVFFLGQTLEKTHSQQRETRDKNGKRERKRAACDLLSRGLSDRNQIRVQHSKSDHRPQTWTSGGAGRGALRSTRVPSNM